MHLFLILALLIPILAIVLDSSLGKALASHLERRSISGGGDGVMQERLVHLEGEVERLGKEVGRLDDESQFLQKLLSDKPAPGGLPPGRDADEA